MGACFLISNADMGIFIQGGIGEAEVRATWKH